MLVRNKLQPKMTNNVDPILFDYKFWTEIEKVSKKYRENSLNEALKLTKTPKAELTSGTVIRGGIYILDLVKGSPMNKFDLETFIDLVLAKHPDERVFLRECAVKAVVPLPGSERHTFAVKES
jgi:hypothetical protein